MKCRHKNGCDQEATHFWTRTTPSADKHEMARRCDKHAPQFADVVMRVATMMLRDMPDWVEISYEEAVVIEVHES
jgi:hypothetical protein